LSHNTRIDDEVAQRISKANQAFGWLQASVWNRHDSPTLTPGINSITPTIIETTSFYSSPVIPTIATTIAFTFTTTTAMSDGDALLNCPQSDHTFTSRIGLVGHLQIRRTETGDSVPGAPTHSRDRCFHCPHCPSAFTHRMGLFGHMRIHNSGTHRNADNTDSPRTP
uniref:C2H2-type domain-containing protein n=1 Tax=Schistocephalus solidus TaxID=70667 RepID=A0A183TH22_SCHSO